VKGHPITNLNTGALKKTAAEAIVESSWVKPKQAQKNVPVLV
jgi:hypothetical protein